MFDETESTIRNVRKKFDRCQWIVYLELWWNTDPRGLERPRKNGKSTNVPCFRMRNIESKLWERRRSVFWVDKIKYCSRCLIEMMALREETYEYFQLECMNGFKLQHQGRLCLWDSNSGVSVLKNNGWDTCYIHIEVVMSLTYNQELPHFCLGWETIYADRFIMIFLSLSRQMPGYYLQISSNILLPKTPATHYLTAIT
jgi:hypothetical protein